MPSNDIFGGPSNFNSLFGNNNRPSSTSSNSNLFNESSILGEHDPLLNKPRINLNNASIPALGGPDDKLDGDADIKFVSLIITEIASYHHIQEIGKRDINPRINIGTINTINDELRSCATGHLTNDNLAGLGMDILSVTATPVAQVDIINGWGTKRHAFMLVLDVHKTWSDERKIISGFTDDSSNISFALGSPTIAKDMRFTINNITTFKISRNKATGLSNVSTQSVEHLLSSTSSNGFMGNGSDCIVNPNSVLTRIADKLESDDDTDTISSCIYPSATGVLIRRDFDHPLNTTKEIINGYHSSLSTSEASDSEATVFQKAAANCNSKRSVADPFLRMICNENRVSQVFLWEQLMRWFPEAYQKSKYVKVDKSALIPYNSGWNNATYSAQVAYLLSQVVPPVMLKYGILSYGFVMTNMNRNTLTRKFDMAITPSDIPYGFYDSNSTVETQRVIDAINDEIVKDLGRMISYNNELGISVTVSYSATCNMYIRLKFSDGMGAEEDYVYPAYASAKFSTSVTNNFNTIDHVSTSFKELIDHLDVPSKFSRSMTSSFTNDIFGTSSNQNNNDPFSTATSTGFDSNFFSRG